MNFHFSHKYCILCCAVLHKLKPFVLVAITAWWLEDLSLMVSVEGSSSNNYYSLKS